MLVGALVLSGTAGYVVRPGDTLSAIAHRFSTTVQALSRANGIDDPNHIVVGQQLTVPGQDPAPASGGGAAGATTYTVRAGDALSLVARRLGVPMSRLAQANGITDPQRIYVGQVLHVPAPVSGAPAGGGSANVTGAEASAPVRAVTRAQAGAIIEKVARQFGWSPAFVKALAWQESGWQMDKVSSTGAVGIMQVMPGTASFVSRALVGRPLDVRDPEDNVTAGVAFLDYLYRLTGKDARLTLGGYYQGLASIARGGVYPDTAQYIANVLALRERFR